jgi:hypothetical protein
MALKYPLANGNWSNAANWNGGTVPAIGDDVRANGFTVTIDVDINVSQISTAASVPALAGGGFVVSTNRTLTCDINWGTSVTLTSSGSPNVTIIGNIYGIQGGVGGLTVSFGSAASVLNITGNVFGASNNSGGTIQSAGTVNFVGNVFGGASHNTASCILITAGGNLVYTGNITAGGGIGPAVVMSGNTSTINGNIYAGAPGGANAGLRITAGINTINANCYGSNIAGATSSGLNVTGSISTVVNGTVYAGTIATSYGLSSSSASVVLSNIEFTNGNTPISGFIKFKNTAPTITVTKADNTTQQLVDPLTTDIPVITNVRNGVVYASGSLTGTLAVPPASSVAVGVPIDNTVGTAIITVTDMGALLASYNV